jgi:cytidylate kinase
MPNVDPLTYIKTVLAKDFAARPPPRKTGPQALVVTVARDYGALGEAVALGLAAALKVPAYDQEILERVAKSAKTDALRFQVHDEQPSAGLSAFLYSLVSGNPATVQDYRHHLCEAVLELARQDCVIVGRGAHLILGGGKAFRVRVVGSPAVCARRVALELGIPAAAAEHKVAEINDKRNQALVGLFGGGLEHCALEHAENFDLVVNTDYLSAGAAVAVILLALREAGHIREVPPWPA